MAPFYGGSRYKYNTPDGSPPNHGIPPADTLRFNAYHSCSASPGFGYGAYCYPPGGLPPGYMFPPYQGPLSTTFVPGMELGALPPYSEPWAYRAGGYGPLWSGPAYFQSMFKPPPAAKQSAPSQSKDSSTNDASTIRASNQVRRVTFPGKTFNYIFPIDQCCFHLVNIKSGAKPWDQANPAFDHEICLAPTNMKLRDFIEECGAQKAGLDKGAPLARCGIAEMLCGNGKWVKASQFLLGDAPDRLAMTLADLKWHHNKEQSGRVKAIWLVFLP